MSDVPGRDNMIARIHQNGIVKDIRLEGIQGEPENFQLSCTALEYGNALAAVLKNNMEESMEAEVNVLSEVGEFIHRMRFISTSRGFSLTDRVEGAYKPTVKFRQRTEKIPDRYLVRVDAEENLNEFYKMTDLGGGEWGATYGRIGAQQGRRRAARNVVIPKSYPDYMFGLKLMEKLRKGYLDKSSCHSVKVMRRQNPDCSTEGISSQRVAEFNRYLLELMHIIPRKIEGKGDQGVKKLLAESTKDYAPILNRETELLDIMEGQICTMNGRIGTEKNILDRMGLDISEAAPDQIQEVRAQLNHSLKTTIKAGILCDKP